MLPNIVSGCDDTLNLKEIAPYFSPFPAILANCSMLFKAVILYNLYNVRVWYNQRDLETNAVGAARRVEVS